jgi:hypothetical protein
MERDKLAKCIGGLVLQLIEMEQERDDLLRKVLELEKTPTPATHGEQS